MFQGFSQQTADFLWALSFHNERPWFLAHKAEFEDVLWTPFRELAWDTAEELEKRFPQRQFFLHISRIYRDARRLYGRGPYRDHLWFTLHQQGRSPAFWFEIGAAGYQWGVGLYGASAEQMERYRASIDANPSKVERLAKVILEQQRFHLDGDVYKRPKKQLGKLLDPWYNRKEIGLSCGENFGGELFSPGLPQTLAEDYSFLMPYYDFFAAAFDTPDQ